LRIGVIGILLSTFIVSALQLIALSAWMLREIPLAFDGPLLKGMLVFGFPLMFSNMALFVLNFSDRFFLQHLRSLEIVGIYAVGYKFGYMLNYLLVQPFMIMWQGRMYAVYRNPDHAAVLRQMFVLFSLVLAFAGLALSLVSPEIIHIMVGSRYAAAQDVIPVVTFAYVWFGIGFFAQTGMYLADKTNRVGAVTAVAAALNIILNYVLIVRFGMVGAAWATLLSFAAMTVGSYWMSRRSLPLPLGALRVAGILSVALVIYFVCRMIAPDALLTGLAVKLTGIAIFPVAIWGSGLLTEPERETIASVWRDSRTKLLKFTPWTVRGAEGL
jgi:O-antigen/teichoic acid export membrane protein